MVRRVAFKKALLAGASGAIAWEAVFRIIELFYPMKFDLVWLLGTMIVAADESFAWWLIGMIVHMAVGALWSVFYAYFFWSVMKAKPVWQGLAFSIVPAVAAGLSLVPQLTYLHPLILGGEIPKTGFFGLNQGLQGPISIFFFHFVYGLTMGSIYFHPSGYPVSRETAGLLKWKRSSRKIDAEASASHPPEIAAGGFIFCTGIECSYPTLENGKWRIDELELTGHYEKWERDLELVAELGIRYLRYGPPLHWIFKGPNQYDWSFLDAVLSRMRELNITPIIDLCHFGLPAWMGNFQNTEFPAHLAAYAEAMAARYPWLRLWNPVNEMFVAARESTLHGTWNEQERSEKAFVRATCNMVRASHLVMQSILRRRKDAVFFTSESSEFYQACCPDENVRRIADFENQRRFIASDLLLSHPVRDDIKRYLFENGMSEVEYEEFMRANLGSHVVMGLDYYPWNENLIDSEGHKESLGELFGWYVITKQYYERYRRPLFHSETNSMDASRGPDWLWRQWHNLELMKSEGIPVIGFTWYSLQDQIDWNIGLSEALGNVNPVGLFDLNRDPRPVLVAFKQMLTMFRDEKMPLHLSQELGL